AEYFRRVRSLPEDRATGKLIRLPASPAKALASWERAPDSPRSSRAPSVLAPAALPRAYPAAATGLSVSFVCKMKAGKYLLLKKYQLPAQWESFGHFCTV